VTRYVVIDGTAYRAFAFERDGEVFVRLTEWNGTL
jgi:hypothetical protein